MSDIVERLNELAGNEAQWSDVWETVEEAANEIEKLRAALNKAVVFLASAAQKTKSEQLGDVAIETITAAAALKETGDE